MADLKLAAAEAALKYINSGQTIGLGAGSTVAHLIDLVCQKPVLASTVTFISSSFKTNNYLLENGLNVQSAAFVSQLDIYFDGCDQFDAKLNALKSGGGIHTTEKILASMAAEFILMGDESKYAEQLSTAYPLVIEILPLALPAVIRRLATDLPGAEIRQRMSSQKDGALISENGNYLADVYLAAIGDPQELNVKVKMIPGIVEHSLFCGMASKAIIAGEHGIRELDMKLAI